MTNFLLRESTNCFILISFLFIYLKEQKSEGETDVICPLIHSPSGYTQPGMGHVEVRGRSSIRVSRTMAKGGHPPPFQAPSQEAVKEAEQLGQNWRSAQDVGIAGGGFTCHATVRAPSHRRSSV